MAANLNVKSGSFTADTTITSPFNQPVTGVGFTPKVVILFSQGLLTALDTNSSTKASLSVGFTTATGINPSNTDEQAAWSGDGGVSTTNVGIWTNTGNAVASLLSDGTPTSVNNGQPYVSSFDADGFT